MVLFSPLKIIKHISIMNKKFVALLDYIDELNKLPLVTDEVTEQ